MNTLKVQPERFQSSFESELINRFFDPKSYYLHGFMSHLRSNKTALEDPINTVTVGLLVDDIINAADKIQKLNQLERFDRFTFYRQQLFEGIKYLEGSRLSTQQMMEIVGSLGKSLAETLMDLMAQNESRKDLLAMVGLDESKTPKEKSAQEPERENPKKSFSKLPKDDSNLWFSFKEDINEKINSIRSYLAKLQQDSANWEAFKQIKNGYRDLRDWSMIYGDQGIEAISHKILLLFEAVYMRAPEKRELVFPILANTIETIQQVNDAGPGSEHLDIVRVMIHQIDKQREVYPKPVGSSLANLEEVPSAKKIQPEQTNETAAALIQKEKAEEPLLPATETSELSCNTDGLAKPGKSGNKEIYNFPEDVFESRGSEPVSGLESKSEVRKSEDFAAEFQSLIEPNQVESSMSAKQSAEVQDNEDVESFDSIRESELMSELMTEHGDRLDQLDIPELAEIENSTAEAQPANAEIELPGENDAELLAIISELQSEHTNAAFAEESGQGEATDFNDEFPAHRSILEPAPAHKAGAENLESKGGKNGFDFLSETDMYFSFAKKALQLLMKNASYKQALEDLELACYSLKIIGTKLGYNQVGTILGNAEQLVQKGLAAKGGLKTDQINTLFSVIDELEKAGRERAFAAPETKRWFDQQEQLLKRWVNENSAKENVTRKQTADKPKMGHAAKDEDPLDFLIFDDSSKMSKPF